MIANGAEHGDIAIVDANEKTAEKNSGWSFYIIPDLMTWSVNAERQTPMERYENFDAAKARFDELRSMDYNNAETPLRPDGQSYARLVLGIESRDRETAADILHVRRYEGTGKNYLVTDFTRMERLKNDPEVMKILSRVSQEIGFDRVIDYEKTGSGYRPCPDVSFETWDNCWFVENAPERKSHTLKPRSRTTERKSKPPQR